VNAFATLNARKIPDAPISQRSAAHSGFFDHHGPWAVGVKLFRVLHFGTKAVLISAVMLVPIVVVFYVYLQKQLDDEAFAKAEIQGVADITAYAPVIQTAVALRNATRASMAKPELGINVDATRAAFDRAIDGLEKHLAASGDPLGFHASFAKLTGTYAAARAKGTLLDASTGGTVWDPVADAAKEVEQDLADKSNLSLDPDASSYYLQAVVTGEISSIATNLGQLRAWSVWFGAKGGADNIDARKYAVWDSRVSDHITTLRDDLARAIAADPTLAINLAPLDIVAGFQQSASTSVLQNEAGDVNLLWKGGGEAQDALFGIYAQALPLLERLLQSRVDRIVHERIVLLAILGVCLAIAAYFYYCFFLAVQGGLDEVRHHLEAMTDGDLTTEAKAWGRDEMASLITSLATMQTSLCALVGQVRAASDNIVQASGEIAAASVDLSGRTEQTASDLASSATSMKQVSAAVKESADHAAEAAQIAAQNSGVAQRGGKVIGDVVDTMQRIHMSSHKIGEIIGTIDGIAFQTNILALNAAVEAARAGDQGRGFAVVASEVRNLAQRSALAAKEIKTLINRSVDEVAAGTRVVQGAGQTMEELLDNANRMNALLAKISAAAQDQSVGVGRVGASILQLDQMTRQNAALVQQTTAAADSLREQATRLADDVAKFRLPEAA
jgi:methyl-accepting chemotaxis protein